MYEYKPVAIVALGTIMPDAEDVTAFWKNILESKVSIDMVPSSRWPATLYFDADRRAPEKTYSKIGGFVDAYHFEPLKWKIPIPPNMQKAMDHPQKWAIACTRQLLLDYGAPTRDLDHDRTAVILGNSLAGELHYTTTLRIRLPEFLHALENTQAFQGLTGSVQQALLEEAVEKFNSHTLPVTEDTMPGELANVIAGRVANVFNFRGPNYVIDAACASSFAALQAAVEGLNGHRFDAVVTGGIDSGMGVEAYVKFSKIGALSPDGSRPYDAGANGFVMGEGAAVFLLKRLEDAERDQDRIYAVIRGIGSSSDGSGKGITAPNPVGQVKAITRGWQTAGLDPSCVGLIEGHGTSTRVGDVVEVNSLHEAFQSFNLPVRSIALGSVKSNIGHLKSAAGAAGMLKTVLALHHKILPPSASFIHPNPDIHFEQMPFYVNQEKQPWEPKPGEIRRAGVSSFGFGGTNFHVVLEEYAPGLHRAEPESEKVYSLAASQTQAESASVLEDAPQDFQEDIQDYILAVVSEKTGYPTDMLDLSLDLEADLGIDTVKQAELFSNVRERFGIARVENLQLSDYNTLEKVIQFVESHTVPEGVTNNTQEIDKIVSLSEVPGSREIDAVKAFILNMISEKTGYPVDVLDLQLDLEADLGIDTVKQAEMFVSIRENFGIERREDLRLSDYNTLEKVIQFVVDALGDDSPHEPEPKNEVVQNTVEDMPHTDLAQTGLPKPIRGLLFIGAPTKDDLIEALKTSLEQAEGGLLPEQGFPPAASVKMPHRLAIDYSDREDLLTKASKSLQALQNTNEKIWFALAGQGIRYGQGDAGKVAFMFPGQGSQYVNMLRDLIDTHPIIRKTYEEADAVLTPILGKPLTAFIFVDGDAADQARGKEALKNTIITQPAVLTCNVALLRLLASYGYQPDMVVGHSLGEYAALVAVGVMPFEDALRVVSARGQEMSKASGGDSGCMAAVSAPLEVVQEMVQRMEGYVVVANLNSPMQSVIGGNTPSVEQAIGAFQDAGYQAVKIPVSQAFHTSIVQPASEPLRDIISQADIKPPQGPIVANVTGDWYPTTREDILDILAAQVYSPVQFIQSIETLYDAGGRVFVEVGPKRVLNVLASEILQEKEDVYITATNHPRKGGRVSFNEAIVCLLAAGIPPNFAQPTEPPALSEVTTDLLGIVSPSSDRLKGSVVVSGTGLGLPGRHKKVFAEDNVDRLLRGEILIDPIPEATRQEMLEKSVIRLVKAESGAQLIELDQLEQTIKLAGQPGEFDLTEEFGLPEARVSALDISTQLAIAAGIDALREAGIPLVMAYKKTTVGSLMPDRWKLPPAMGDETGVIFASAFPALSAMSEELDTYYAFQSRQKELAQLKAIFERLDEDSPSARDFIRSRMAVLEEEISDNCYHLDRNFVFRVLTMGHSQFAEYIGARGPNTHVNGACASTTQAIGVAEDWIRTGRCRRVVVIAGDDIASGSLMQWIGSSLMASGAATVEGDLRLAAMPFDKRRNGMVIGMGAAALVVEAQDAVAERGMTGICEVLSSEFANSAFHGTRLEVEHVSDIMGRLLSTAEKRFNIKRDDMAGKMVFVSHETYTPARGGSASAEIYALRNTFGDLADQVIIANTKGFTGHSMGVGIEDVLAVKALELGKVPPIANYDGDFEPDPDLGELNLSSGGDYNPDFALRLGAGFGSQLAMTLYRRIPCEVSRTDTSAYQDWLSRVTGHVAPELEVEKRTLRVIDIGPPDTAPIVSTWQYGQGPVEWAAKPGDTVRPEYREDYETMSHIDVTVPADPTPDLAVRVEPVMQTLEVDPVKAFCLDLISEKTGYPVEMLDLNLDLEADLGIDTVKQAEIFSELRQHYHLPLAEDLRLSDYNTLAKVIGFIEEMIDKQNSPRKEGQDATRPVQEKTQPKSEDSTGNRFDPDVVQATILELVSEKTGYPQDVLDLTLDLEADLGIDTVKQAELFATLRELYDLPVREDLALSSYNTLEKVIGFVLESRSAVKVTQPVEPIQTQEDGDEDQEEGTIVRRVPIPVLRPRLSLCQPTGISLEPGDSVLVVSEKSGIGLALAEQLTSWQVRVDHFVSPEDIGQFNHKGYKGIFFLNALKPLDDIEPLDAAKLLTELETSIYLLHQIILKQGNHPLSFLVAGTQSGGAHGYDQTTTQISLVGAVAGYLKTLSREWDGTLAKVVDLETGVDPAWAAAKMLAEITHDPAVVEVGWKGEERYTIQALPQKHPEKEGLKMGAETTFLISGGAGGILGPILKNLASRTGGNFILLGRTEPPGEAENDDLSRVLTDRVGLKNDLIEKARQSQDKFSPAQVEKTLADLEKKANIHQVVNAITKSGGSATYYDCDVTNVDQVVAVLDRVNRELGSVDVLIHAAGIEKSRSIKHKDLDEFRRVFEVKVIGFYNLYKALLKQDRSLQAVQVFSSIAGRFGNPGQADYAAANDTLCRWMLAMGNRSTGTLYQALDWSAWAEVGMAARGFIPEVMSRAGIELLPPHIAAPLAGEELASGSSGEVLLSGALGILEEQLKCDDGLNLELVNHYLQESHQSSPLFNEVSGSCLAEGISLEGWLDPMKENFLIDHALRGIPVLPGVMGIAGFVEAAELITSALLTEGEGFKAQYLSDIRFEQPLKFYRDEPRQLRWKVQVVLQDGRLVARLGLGSLLKTKLGETRMLEHFSANVHLGPSHTSPSIGSYQIPQLSDEPVVTAQDIYGLYFHGPSFQVLDLVQRQEHLLVGACHLNPMKMAETLVGSPSHPLLVESCFQTAGVWEISDTGRFCLPRSIGSLTLHHAKLNGSPVYACVLPKNTHNGAVSFDAWVIDAQGQVYLEMKDYRTMVLSADLDQGKAQPFKVMIGENLG